MISRSMGPTLGATVGLLYWLGITLLAVLEVLGAVEAYLIASPSHTPFIVQMLSTVLMFILFLWVYAGIRFVSKLGIFFIFVVFYTIFSYYYGLLTVTPDTKNQYTAQDDQKCSYWLFCSAEGDFSGPPGMVTGLEFGTMRGNRGAHYSEGVHFGVVMSTFFLTTYT